MEMLYNMAFASNCHETVKLQDNFGVIYSPKVRCSTFVAKLPLCRPVMITITLLNALLLVWILYRIQSVWSIRNAKQEETWQKTT